MNPVGISAEPVGYAASPRSVVTIESPVSTPVTVARSSKYRVWPAGTTTGVDAGSITNALPLMCVSVLLPIWPLVPWPEMDEEYEESA